MAQSEGGHRPGLIPCPVAEVLAALTTPRESVTVTIRVGQRLAALHRAAYARGCYLLELDDDDRPVAAYRKATAG